MIAKDTHDTLKVLCDNARKNYEEAWKDYCKIGDFGICAAVNHLDDVFNVIIHLHNKLTVVKILCDKISFLRKPNCVCHNKMIFKFCLFRY